MDAVNHKETTAMIRLYSNNDSPAQTFSPSEKVAPATRGSTQGCSIPDHVKKQAMDAIANKETMAQIRLVKDNGSPFGGQSPTATPGHDTNKVAEKVASLHQSGHGADSVHQAMTKDNFAREHG